MSTKQTKQTKSPQQKKMKELTALDVLIAARSLISDSSRWIKGSLARRTKNSSYTVGVSDPLANCFCAMGAIRRVAHMNGCWNLTNDAGCKLGEVMPKPPGWVEQSPLNFLGAESRIIDFNDKKSRTHTQVLAKFDKAIEKAKAEKR